MHFFFNLEVTLKSCWWGQVNTTQQHKLAMQRNWEKKIACDIFVMLLTEKNKLHSFSFLLLENIIEIGLHFLFGHFCTV